MVPEAKNRSSRRRRRGGVGWSIWDGKGGYEPTQADTRGRRLARGEATGADEVDADGVGTGKAVASGSVGFGGRLGESGKEVGVAVGRLSSTFEGVGVCGEELEPAPNAGVMLAYLGDALERLVVGVDAELWGPEVAAQPFDGPDSQSRLIACVTVSASLLSNQLLVCFLHTSTAV